jgi:hypothetical protein
LAGGVADGPARPGGGPRDPRCDELGLSKSEVERIFLPFLLWLVPLTALLPAGHTRRWLAASAGWALAFGTVFRTTW